MCRDLWEFKFHCSLLVVGYCNTLLTWDWDFVQGQICLYMENQLVIKQSLIQANWGTGDASLNIVFSCWKPQVHFLRYLLIPRPVGARRTMRRRWCGWPVAKERNEERIQCNLSVQLVQWLICFLLNGIWKVANSRTWPCSVRSDFCSFVPIT